MSVGGGRRVAPSVLETLEFPAALARVAAHAAGPLGAARVAARTPLTDPDVVRAALAQVAELAARLLTDEAIRAEPVPDVAEPLALLAVPGSALEGPALATLGAVLAAARLVAAELDRLKAEAPRTAALRAELPPKVLERRLHESIAADGQVLDSASAELGRARRAVRETRARLVRRLEGLLASLAPVDRAGDAAVTVRGGRYVIPIRATARGKVGGIVHDESATRATLFVEPPEVIELGNELRGREVAEQREVLRVLRELTEQLRPRRAAIARAFEMCIAFDDLCARARYAVAVNGFAPRVGDGPFAIRGGRHPLLVHASPPSPVSPSSSEEIEGGEGEVVPFDLELAADEWTVLVSGPNTGGKTVLIKAVGLVCLMSQSGIIPPLGPQSSLPVFEGVFADIGDRQSIAASLSTFSAHAAALREVLERSGPGSLVLLDEIGSGTDPAEGAALAAAALRALTRRRTVTLATTHLGALKRLAAETVGIVNASLQFDADTLAPTYRLVKGVPGRSYGLAIARRLGLPSDVLAEAERAVPAAERELDALLAEVERRAAELERATAELDGARARLETERAALEGVAAEVDRRERAVRSREKALEAEARERARAYLLEARQTVEAALAQARAAVDEATAKEARRHVEQAIEKIGDAGRQMQDGWMSLDDLRRRSSPATPPVSVRPRPSPSVASASSEISLRGLRADEAERELVAALDAAVLADLPYLRIIHGKGTGALRALVHRVVGDDPRVARFGLAPANQGGAGVTVVELRP